MSTADELRRDFDTSFALSPGEAEPRLAMLAVRVGGRGCLVPLADVANVTRSGIVTPAPSRRRELVGIAAIRGRIVPVFDLAALLGDPSDAEHPWLVLVNGEHIAFAVAAVDGYVAVPRAAIVGRSVTLDGVAKSIVPLAGLVEQLVRKET